MSVDSYVDFTLESKDGTVLKPFTTDVEMFFYNEGYLTFDDEANNGKGQINFTWGDPDAAKNYTKEAAIEAVFNDMIPNK